MIFRGACLSSTDIECHSVCLCVTLFQILQVVQYYNVTSCPKLSLVVLICHKLSKVVTSCHKFFTSCHKLSKVVTGFQKSSQVVTSCNHWLLIQLVTSFWTGLTSCQKSSDFHSFCNIFLIFQVVFGYFHKFNVPDQKKLA